MKKIIFVLIAVLILSSVLMADMVTATKDGERVAILQGHADRFNNTTLEWEFDDGAEISSVRFVQGYQIIGRLYSYENPITNGLGDFFLPETVDIYWYQIPGQPGHYYNFDYVTDLKYTYHGTQFTAQPGDSVLLKFVQGY